MDKAEWANPRRKAGRREAGKKSREEKARKKKPGRNDGKKSRVGKAGSHEPQSSTTPEVVPVAVRPLRGRVRGEELGVRG